MCIEHADDDEILDELYDRGLENDVISKLSNDELISILDERGFVLTSVNHSSEILTMLKDGRVQQVIELLEHQLPTSTISSQEHSYTTAMKKRHLTDGKIISF